MHASREISFGNEDEEVVVRRHQAVHEARPPVLLEHGGEDVQERDSVAVVPVDRRAAGAANVDVEDRFRPLEPRQSTHEPTVDAAGERRSPLRDVFANLLRSSTRHREDDVPGTVRTQYQAL